MIDVNNTQKQIVVVKIVFCDDTFTRCSTIDCGSLSREKCSDPCVWPSVL